MTKWETVYTQVLDSVIANYKGDFLQEFIDGRMEHRAKTLAMIARMVANSAIDQIDQHNLYNRETT